MDNNNEYKRNVGIGGKFPGYDEVPTEEDYSSTSSYESSDASGFSNLGMMETKPSFDFGSSTMGSYTASYTANYNEPKEEAGSASKDGYSSFFSGSSLQNGMDSNAYQSLYSDYDSSQVNNYKTSAYSAPSDSYSAPSSESYSSPTRSDSYSAPSDSYSNQSGSYTPSNSGYGAPKDDYSAPKDDYSAPKDDYSAPKDDYSASNDFSASSDYSAPKDDYTAPNAGFNYDYGTPVNRSDNDYSYDSYESAPTKDFNSFDGSMQGNYNTQELPQAGGTTYSSVPLDKKGRPLKNKFGFKLTLSIIEIVFATLWGILGLIFTCMANNAYNRGDWESFQSKSKIASIMLWIGLVLTILSIAAISVLVGAGLNSFGSFRNGDSNSYVVEESVEDTVVDDGDDPIVDDGVVGETVDVGDLEVKDYNIFQFNGSELTVPGTAADFIETLEANGYTFEYDVHTTHVKPKSGEYLSFYNPDGYVIGFVEIYNTHEEEIYMIDGVIGGINIDVDWEEKIKIDYINGISNNSDLQDYVEVLGEPSTADDKYGMYTWNTDEGWIEINIKDGTLSSFTIYAYTMLQ